MKNMDGAMVLADGMVANPNLVYMILKEGTTILPSFIKIGRRMCSVTTK